MTIVVVKTANPVKYETTCTDKKCRAVLHFDHDDIKFNTDYSMGRVVDRHEGIVCPECNQVLKIKDFKILTDDSHERQSF
jgi:hypothetical protein